MNGTPRADPGTAGPPPRPRAAVGAGRWRTLLHAPESTLLLALIVWIAATAWMSPQFGGRDIYSHKQPGVNWALGRGFVARLIPGSQTLEPAFYASYPPLFPFAFELFCRVFGVGAYQNTFFTLLISFLPCVLFARMAARAEALRGARILWPIVLALLCLAIPGGLTVTSPDRPEPLSFAILLLTLLLPGAPIAGRTAANLGFALAGANFLVAPFGGVMNFLALLLVHGRSLRRGWHRRIVGWAGRFGAPIVFVVGAELLFEPLGYRRFLEHSALAVRASASGDPRIYMGALWDALVRSGAQSFSLVVSWAAIGLLLIPLVVKRYRSTRRRPVLLLGLALLGLLVFPALLFPRLNTYMAFARSTVLALLVFGEVALPEAVRAGKRWIVPAFLIVVARNSRWSRVTS